MCFWRRIYGLRFNDVGILHLSGSGGCTFVVVVSGGDWLFRRRASVSHSRRDVFQTRFLCGGGCLRGRRRILHLSGSGGCTFVVVVSGGDWLFRRRASVSHSRRDVFQTRFLCGGGCLRGRRRILHLSGSGGCTFVVVVSGRVGVTSHLTCGCCCASVSHSRCCRRGVLRSGSRLWRHSLLLSDNRGGRLRCTRCTRGCGRDLHSHWCILLGSLPCGRLIISHHRCPRRLCVLLLFGVLLRCHRVTGSRGIRTALLRHTRLINTRRHNLNLCSSNIWFGDCRGRIIHYIGIFIITRVSITGARLRSFTNDDAFSGIHFFDIVSFRRRKSTRQHFF